MIAPCTGSPLSLLLKHRDQIATDSAIAQSGILGTPDNFDRPWNIVNGITVYNDIYVCFT